ncbi:hypothetical protein [Algoriphagus resistens]|uniref:hypothetical protein n=1 Tax=Algoriphagus resistens TaxID=1750590 RepID=UPI0018DEF5C4|nr:hypothetical protein [Algoriphagus resistens]
MIDHLIAGQDPLQYTSFFEMVIQHCISPIPVKIIEFNNILESQYGYIYKW